jgi:hypothetical protein
VPDEARLEDTTKHSFVGVGEAPCVILMVGARTEQGTVLYPRDHVALRHGAGVEAETTGPGRGVYAILALAHRPSR